MKYRQFLTTVFLVVALPLCIARAETTDVEASNAIKAVIANMNQAVTERDIDLLLTTFANGAINIEMFPAKKYGETEASEPFAAKTRSLQERWQSIAPILFSTKKYERRATVQEVLVEGNMAMARINIETESLSAKEGATTKQSSFRELCLLRRYESGWKIVSLTNDLHDEAR